MKLYNDYGNWIRNKFGYRVQKISIDAGFSCPNRDGSIGKGGCIYCNNASFSPSYCSDTANRQSQEEMLNLEADNIRRQLRRGKQFFDRKYPDMKYIAYFQSFTNTYGPIARLKALYGKGKGGTARGSPVKGADPPNREKAGGVRLSKRGVPPGLRRKLQPDRGCPAAAEELSGHQKGQRIPGAVRH